MPAATEDGAGGGPERRRTVSGRTALLVVDALLVVVLAAVLLARHLTDPGTGSAQVDATAAAKTAAVDLVSVSWQALPAQGERARSRLDPRSRFAQDYVRFLPQLQDTARANKLVITAEVVAAGVQRVIDPTHVQVLAFVDEVSTNSARSAPRVDQSRVVLHMVRRGSQWLVQGLDAV